MSALTELYDEIFAEAKENQKWLEKNWKTLVKQYPEQFIFVSNKKVIDHDSDMDRLLDKVPHKYRKKEHTIEYVTREKVKLILYADRRIF